VSSIALTQLIETANYWGRLWLLLGSNAIQGSGGTFPGEINCGPG